MYRILVIEDDRSIADAIATLLTAWDMNAHTATNFRNILGEFSSFEPHLILLDIRLPFYNGYHWCQEIRRVSKVPIIFISSAADSMNIVMAMNMGADDFIAKPFDMNVLTACSFVVFGVMYAAVYKMTSNAYFAIVSNTQNS